MTHRLVVNLFLKKRFTNKTSDTTLRNHFTPSLIYPPPSPYLGSPPQLYQGRDEQLIGDIIVSRGGRTTPFKEIPPSKRTPLPSANAPFKFYEIFEPPSILDDKKVLAIYPFLCLSVLDLKFPSIFTKNLL